MDRFRPSDIIKFIDNVFPNAEKTQKEGGEFLIHPDIAGRLQDLLEMLDKMHEGYLNPLSNDDLNRLCACKTEIKKFLENLQSRGPTITLRKTPGISKENPVILIRRLLEKLPF